MPQLSTTVIRVAYPPSTDRDADWFILITSSGTCKGKMAWRPQEKEALILDGEWATYHGEREFKFSTARLNIPSNPRDQLHYVCTRTNGLGPAAEELIWAKYGEAWQDVKSGDVPRLSGKVYERFRLQVETLIEKSEEARVVAALMGKGATINMAQAAWEMWKLETLGVVNANPYRLAELAGYGFRDVDGKIRRAYGIVDDDERRIKSAVVYALRRLTDGGDTVVAWDDLYVQAAGLLRGHEGLITACTKALFEEGTLKAFAESGGVALASDWRAECAIWEWVNNDEGD